uniref:AA_permease domain-containing protein n=1 Tax=Caenorhabditis tropicalis TaxID=1561998 RepID=A0A1I7UUM7_9PELO
MSSLLRKILRTRRVDEQFLRHSEWARRLGIPLMVALAGIKSISMMLFIILPFCLTQVAGPSTVLALIFAFLIIFFTAAHLSEISCTMPKNCVQYHFAYAVVGELPAFVIAWISLVDYVAQAGLFCKAWADHFNLLFRGLPAKSLTFDVFSENSSILSPQIDILTVLSALITLCLLLCSLRVVGTICVSLLAVTLLIAASCTMVAFFHSDPENWIKAEFFHFGYQGVLYSICALCACYTGIESTSCLLEETKNPRKRISGVLSFLVLVLTTIFFVLSITFSLSTNVTALSEGIMIPEVFSVINIPAAKYMLSVCSVCALSGGVLASFLPATRVIAALCHDRLIPYARDTSTKSPYFAVLLCTVLVSLCSMIQKTILLNFVIFMAPVKMIITILLVYIQHYYPEPIGIPEETSSYKSIGKKRTRVNIDDGVSIDDSVSSMAQRVQKPDDDESEVSHSTFDTTAFLYMKATKMETERLQRRLEKESIENDSEERQPVLAKSVSQYHSMDQNAKKHQKSKKHSHNCVAEQCGVDNDDDYNSQEVHLFANEEPELPFFSTFSSSAPRPPSPDVSFHNFNKSQRLLFLFCFMTSAFSTFLRNFAMPSTSCWLISVGFVVVILIFTVNINRLQTNDYLYKKESKVTLFPTASLFSLFLLLVSFFGSVPTRTLSHLIFISLTGFFSYFLYGYRHSKHRKTACLVIENRYSETADDQYCPIIGLDTSSSSDD